MTNTLQILIKAAGGHTTYDYASFATSRNYTPKKPSIKPGYVKIDTGVEERRMKAPKPTDTGLPKPGANKPGYEESLPFNTFLHTFNGISGTGYGRRYWGYKDNPFMS